MRFVPSGMRSCRTSPQNLRSESGSPDRSFRPGPRVKGVAAYPGGFEMTWDNDHGIPATAEVATGIGSAVCSVRGNSWLARHGKAADSEQILMEDDHCSGREVFSDLIKVGEND
jgi:hypothetical protein